MLINNFFKHLLEWTDFSVQHIELILFQPPPFFLFSQAPHNLTLGWRNISQWRCLLSCFTWISERYYKQDHRIQCVVVLLFYHTLYSILESRPSPTSDASPSERRIWTLGSCTWYSVAFRKRSYPRKTGSRIFAFDFLLFFGPSVMSLAADKKSTMHSFNSLDVPKCLICSGSYVKSKYLLSPSPPGKSAYSSGNDHPCDTEYVCSSLQPLLLRCQLLHSHVKVASTIYRIRSFLCLTTTVSLTVHWQASWAFIIAWPVNLHQTNCLVKTRTFHTASISLPSLMLEQCKTSTRELFDSFIFMIFITNPSCPLSCNGLTTVCTGSWRPIICFSLCSKTLIRSTSVSNRKVVEDASYVNKISSLSPLPFFYTSSTSRNTGTNSINLCPYSIHFCRFLSKIFKTIA